MMNEEQSLQQPRHHRQIEVVAEATTVQGWRKQVVAGQRGEEQFTFLSDEGSYMPGGQGTAPTPLTYFVSGVAL
jgi:histidinol dehydrogenase